MHEHCTKELLLTAFRYRRTRKTLGGFEITCCKQAKGNTFFTTHSLPLEFCHLALHKEVPKIQLWSKGD